MKSDQDKMTVLVNSCDAYSDVWPLFFSALNEFWPDRQAKVVLNVETAQPTFKEKNIVVSNCRNIKKEDLWGERLIEALRNIETEYVLMLYDDFILEGRIDNFELSKIISRMDSDSQIAVVYLTKTGQKTQEGSYLMPSRKEGNWYALIDNNVAYRLNSAPAIWRRKDLLNYTGRFDSPWAWEVFGTYRTFGDKMKFYCPCEKEEDVFKYNYSKGGAIYRGKWVGDVVLGKNERYGLNIDFTKRGLSMHDGYEKRGLRWKVNFLLLGYKMVGLKVFNYIYRAFKDKYL